MSAEPYIRSFELVDDAWTPIADSRMVLDGKLSAPADNTQSILVRVDEGASQEWHAGRDWEFQGLDLSRIQFRAQTAGDIVFVTAQSSVRK